MGNQFVQQGELIDFVAGGTPIAAGQLVVFGEGVFQAANAIPANTLGSLQTTGVVEYTKHAGEAWLVGQRLWFDAANNRLTTTASTHKQAGIAAAAALSAAVEGRVLLGCW